MVIGDGDIASVLQDREGFLFFASGVSNSRETRESEYQREVDLIRQQPKDQHIVYFSSLAALYDDSLYLEHKRKMESIVRTEFAKHTIVRLGNISWGNNPHTLINHLRAHPKSEIKDVYRYIVGLDEFLYWVNLIPDWNCEISIPGRRMKVQEVYDEYVAK